MISTKLTTHNIKFSLADNLSTNNHSAHRRSETEICSQYLYPKVQGGSNSLGFQQRQCIQLSQNHQIQRSQHIDSKGQASHIKKPRNGRLWNKMRKISLQVNKGKIFKGAEQFNQLGLLIHSDNFARKRRKTKKVSFFIENTKKSFAEPLKNKEKASKNPTPSQLLEASVQKMQRFDIEQWRLQINKISQCFQQLAEVGAVDKKIQNWCFNYFQNKKQGLLDIFMNRVVKKSSLNNEVVYIPLSTAQKLSFRLQQAGLGMTEKERYFLGVELGLYRHFLQQKIASKHNLQLNQIQNRVKGNILQMQMKQFAKQLYQYDTTNSEIIGFFSDLQKLEENYGKLQLVSLKNRKKFENISMSEQKIKKIIYE